MSSNGHNILNKFNIFFLPKYTFLLQDLGGKSRLKHYMSYTIAGQKNNDL